MGGVATVPGRGRKPKPAARKVAAGNPGKPALNKGKPDWEASDSSVPVQHLRRASLAVSDIRLQKVSGALTHVERQLLGRPPPNRDRRHATRIGLSDFSKAATRSPTTICSLRRR